MPKSPSPYIQHIIDAVSQITEYIQGLDEREFCQNNMAKDAVVRQLEVIGEACSKLELSFKASHSHIPWSQIMAMRNKLAHEYWDIDEEIIWQAATVEAPKLKNELLDLLNILGK